MNVCWYSAGVSSFVAAYLARNILDKVLYCHIEDQHPDSLRFIADSENALGGSIETMQSPYESVDEVIRAFRFINSRHGAKCTDVLKRRVRKQWESNEDNLTYFWGYDADERARADLIVKQNPKQSHRFPLIEANLTKKDCHGLLENLGIKRPKMYDMGYRNNNCVGCVKGGMGYWNKIRVDFPEVFALRARREREIGHTCINGVYLDELDPERGRIDDEVMPTCSMMCQLVAEEL